ncbi:hypothetical protein DB30_03966 [Enhygromyxa salina]|uniref:Uncharacterized protein n=1 Tax=Enhygromyxa salina TaxID=215803 RepID=A0A0C2DAR5_9BACT|nr:hypothetical protein DB30_03966 [Enhygromyxa salina]
MNHRLEVADGVVDIALRVPPQRVRVVRHRHRAAVGRQLGGAALRGPLRRVLAPGRLDQPIQRVVAITVRRLDDRVLKIDRLLRVVADVRDVADWIIVILQALQLLAVARAGGLDRAQPEAQRVVLVGGGRRVGGVGDRLSPAADVVGDLRNHGRRRARAAVLAIDGFQRAALVVPVRNLRAVGRDRGQHPPERVVGARRRVHGRLERGRGGGRHRGYRVLVDQHCPVVFRGWVERQLNLRGCREAFVIVCRRGRLAAAVVGSVSAATMVCCLRTAERFPVDHA